MLRKILWCQASLTLTLTYLKGNNSFDFDSKNVCRTLMGKRDYIWLDSHMPALLVLRSPRACPDVTSVNKDGPREARPSVPSKTKVSACRISPYVNLLVHVSNLIVAKSSFSSILSPKKSQTRSKNPVFYTNTHPPPFVRNGFARLSSEPAECVNQGPLNGGRRTVRDVVESSLKSWAIFGCSLPLHLVGDSSEVRKKQHRF